MHRFRNWWTNLAPLSILQLALRYTIWNPNLQHILDDQSSCQLVTRQEKPLWFLANTIGKPKGVLPTFVSFPRAHTFQGDRLDLVYRHASATWDEPSPEKRERAMRFQTGTTSHTKVTRLERNVILGRGMDLNSLTWLLVISVFFQMYTTLALIQSTYNFGDATTWHPNQVYLPIFNTLHYTLSVRGGRYHVIWLKLFLIHLEVHQLLEKQLQPSMNPCSWIVENPIHQVLQTHFPTPFHVFPTTFLLWGTDSLRRTETRSQTY